MFAWVLLCVQPSPDQLPPCLAAELHWTHCASALSPYRPFMFGLVVNPAESVDLNNAETCNHFLPWLARKIQEEAPGKDTKWEEAGVSSLNEGLNGTLPSKDWNYCHMELQIEFK